jgi:hypothetical protein
VENFQILLLFATSILLQSRRVMSDEGNGVQFTRDQRGEEGERDNRLTTVFNSRANGQSPMDTLDS